MAYVQLGSIHPETVDDDVLEALETSASDDWMVVRDGVPISMAAFEEVLTTDELVERIRDGLITEVVRYDPLIERSEALETASAVYAEQFTLEMWDGRGWTRWIADDESAWEDA